MQAEKLIKYEQALKDIRKVAVISLNPTNATQIICRIVEDVLKDE